MFRQLSERLLVQQSRASQIARYYWDLMPKALEAKEVARRVFNTHPAELQAYLEQFYSQGTTPVAVPFIAPTFSLTGQPPWVITREFRGAQKRPLRWDHLIYAYMIENTRVYEVFRRVLYEYRHGEKLGTPLDTDTQNWLTATEQLFYSELAPFSFTNVSSHVRADMRASRRNAYQRMFGMELNHGDDDGKAYPFKKAEANNSEFVSTLEEFLREVWIGIANAENKSGANPKDDAKIAELASKLQNMLRSRRTAGNLAREEYAFVSTMSWFHLTLQFNSPIVMSLRAEADGPENRLFKIAERVGLPAHGLARHFFEIADPISHLLIEIEAGTYSNVANAAVLYTSSFGGVANPVPGEVGRIITHWTATTGRDVKARKVATS
jgi:hypothetical protein